MNARPATQRLSIRSNSRASSILDLLKQFWLGGGGSGTIRPPKTHNMSNMDSGNVFMAFENFLASGSDPYILLEGHEVTLNILQRCLLSGAEAQRFQEVSELSPFTPIATALNAVRSALQIAVMTEEVLYRLSLEPWFSVLVEVYRQQNKIDSPLCIEKILSGHICCLDVHSSFLLVKAVQISYNLLDLDLGIIQLKDNMTSAFVFGQDGLHDAPTAWLLAQGAPGTLVFHGIGSAPEQQVEIVELETDREGDSEEDSPERTSPAASSTPRKTATRIIALQTPLPGDLSAKDSITNHPRSLHYINLLKVFKILEKLPMLHQTKAGKEMEMKKASGVVKRLKVAIEWLEKLFEITKGALRGTYDQARVANGRKVRSNKEAEEASDAAEGTLIVAIMAWIKQGGPMPAGLTASAHQPTSTVAAPAATGDATVSPVARNATPARPALPHQPSPEPFSINYNADAAAEADALAIFTRQPRLY
ncbi:hypothetical protein D6C80_07454 [Aureobasidium pullulans]|nr:hypothetical protein D6C80_07454 [Aureobasidium pullulans]